jgi:hypothetical protein
LEPLLELGFDFGCFVELPDVKASAWALVRGEELGD